MKARLLVLKSSQSEVLLEFALAPYFVYLIIIEFKEFLSLSQYNYCFSLTPTLRKTRVNIWELALSLLFCILLSCEVFYLVLVIECKRMVLFFGAFAVFFCFEFYVF